MFSVLLVFPRFFFFQTTHILQSQLQRRQVKLSRSITNKKPEGFMQSCTLFKQAESHISHFLMRSMGAAILEKLSLILRNSL